MGASALVGRRSGRRVAAWFVVGPLIWCLAGCAPAETDDRPDLVQPEVLLTFVAVDPDEEVVRTANSGRLPVQVDVVSAGEGTVRGGTGMNGGAVRLPAWAEQGASYAVLRVQPTGPDDELSPGERAFEFGADFALDAASTGSQVDNGDNLVQRGLAVDQAQYKIELDARRPSCRVGGDSGSMTVRSESLVEPETWYRVRCTRRGDTLTLSVAEILPNGDAARAASFTGTGSIGSVEMPLATPLSVGGKLSGDGRIIEVSTDQFNGLVDQVVYRLHD